MVQYLVFGVRIEYALSRGKRSSCDLDLREGGAKETQHVDYPNTITIHDEPDPEQTRRLRSLGAVGTACLGKAAPARVSFFGGYGLLIWIVTHIFAIYLF